MVPAKQIDLTQHETIMKYGLFVVSDSMASKTWLWSGVVVQYRMSCIPSVMQWYLQSGAAADGSGVEIRLLALYRRCSCGLVLLTCSIQ